MDQQSVESLLRRLVQRVEESERRYSEALDDLHARLDQLSQTTDAARAAGAPEDAETFDRLHDQVSSLARRLEREAINPLDDFERLGRALAGDLDYAAGMPGVPSSTPDLPDAASPRFPATRRPSSKPFASRCPCRRRLSRFSFSPPDLTIGAFAASPLRQRPRSRQASRGDGAPARAFARRGDAAGSARGLERAARRDRTPARQGARQAPKTLSLEPVERQISDMAQQLGRAEAQLAKIGEIESALHQTDRARRRCALPRKRWRARPRRRPPASSPVKRSSSGAPPSASMPCIATSWR